MKNPVGLYGQRLDLETHIITASVAAVKNLAKCVKMAGVDVERLVVNWLASAEAVLTEHEKELGVIIADIGGGTTMTIRPLALLDLPQLYRYRDEAIGLDTVRTLTRGNPLGAVGLFSYVNPVRHIYSAVANGEESSVLGGVIHSRNDTFAKLLYLAPASQLYHPHLPELIENLSAQAGEWGAFHVLAEVDEVSDAFVPLRKSGFSVYAWQRMWDVSELASQTLAGSEAWTRIRSSICRWCRVCIIRLCRPCCIRSSSLPKTLIGWIINDGAKCYVSMSHGAYGIVLTPLIHPEAREVSAKLTALISHLPDRRNRPVYLQAPGTAALPGTRPARWTTRSPRHEGDSQSHDAPEPRSSSVDP